MSRIEPVQVEPVTPHQVKAARLLLGWSMSRLGMRSGTSVHTVKSFEQTGRVASMYGRTKQVDAVAGNWGKTPGKDEPHSNLYH